MVVRSKILAVFSLLLLVGCGSGRDVSDEALESMIGDKLKETIPVSGVVTVNGTPTGKVTMLAYTKESGMKPVADITTEEDGTYCWTTYRSCDGLPAGDYRLAFKHIPKEGKGKDRGDDAFGGKYSNPMEHDFTLTVASGSPQTDVNYDLQAD